MRSRSVAVNAAGGSDERTIGYADQDGSPASQQLATAFESANGVKLETGTQDELLAKMKDGQVSAVIVVPQGFAQTVAAKAEPASVTIYTDPSQSAADGATRQLVGFVLSVVAVPSKEIPPAVEPTFQAIQTNNLSFISYLVPSILGMSLMQVGIFAAIPLVADRQKLILKRLQATPLRRWQLVGSNVLMRLLIAVVQTVIIVGVGATLYGVEIAGSWLGISALIILGSLTFIALGYVIASFAATEDAANAMTSAVQFPLMFLSGTFFPIAAMPDALKAVARLLPLTYLNDALRQVMVDGTPFAPLWFCVAFLVAWLVGCLVIAGRWFKWQ